MGHTFEMIVQFLAYVSSILQDREDLGEHILAGERVKIGSPGCAGTLTEYRNRGIGMVMLRNVTKILRDAMYDYSYVHHTYETEWLKKLGYEVVLRWDDRGFIWS